MNISGAELIIHILEQHGVRTVAGVPGGAILPLYEALGRSTQIRHILARHEQAAGFIAQGMARITGKAGVCIATSGPGVTNIVTALADAKLDSVPMICIAGQVATHLIGTDAFQEVATLDMVRPITKACYFIESVEQIIEVFNEAFRVAESGRPGPVLIDVPKNVQTTRIHIPQSITPQIKPQPNSTSLTLVPDINAFDTAARMITGAERPIFYFGGGVVKARAQSLARQLAETTQIPMTTTLMGLGILPREHKLNLGMLGMHGARYTNLAIDACDLLIAVGARFDDRATGDPATFAPNAKIIHIDIDAKEFGKIKTPTLSIHSDAASALQALLNRSAEMNDAATRRHWLQHIQQLQHSHPLITPNDNEVCSPYGLMRTLSKVMPANAIVTTDVGQHQMWAAQRLSVPRADHWLTSGGLGTMGFGLPAAIGAALAKPDHTVTCITGDGSLLMNIQEFATLAELNLNVKIVLLDNAALGLVRQQQELFYSRRYVASQFATTTDFIAIASAFGLSTCNLNSSGNAEQALQLALQAPGPTLIRVAIDPTAQVLPMVAPGQANTQALDHASPVARELAFA